MRLLSVTDETLQAFQSLQMPFDHVTPDGLWGTGTHLIGVSPEQAGVLERFGVNLQDITPQALLAAASGFGARVA